MKILNNNILLISGLVSTISELFPNFGWSYWLPRNLDGDFYNRKLYQRILVVLIVWSPIFYNLYKLNRFLAIIAVSLVTHAFYLRAYSESHNKSNKSGMYYTLGFSIIIYILTEECSTFLCKFDNILSYFLILFGGYLINHGRYNDIKLDILGRLVFTAGFINFISNLIQLRTNKSKRSIVSKMVYIVSLVSVIIYIFRNKISVNDISTNTYYDDGSELSTIRLFKEILQNNGYKKGFSKNDSNIILPSLFDNSEKILRNDMVQYNNKIFFKIPHSKVIGNRYLLWKVLTRAYDRTKCESLMPYTYLLPRDYDKYRKEYDKKQLMVFKILDHKQDGIYITDTLVPLNMIKSEKFIVAQKYLEDPYLYKNHKINVRMYLCIIIDGKNLRGYIFDDGIISYSKEKGGRISSFYDSTELYDKDYPITFNQLFPQEYDLRRKCNKQISDVLQASYESILSNIDLNDNMSIEIFGVDFFLDKNLDSKILEINTGPGCDYYNDNDKKMREKLMNSVLKLIINGECHNFMKIFSR